MLSVLKQCYDIVGRKLLLGLARLLPLALVVFALEIIAALAVFHVLVCLTEGGAAAVAGSMPSQIGRWLTFRGEVSLAWTASLLMAVYVLKNAFRFADLYARECFAERVVFTVSRDLFRRYLSAPLEFHFSRNSADLIRNLVGGTEGMLRDAVLAILIISTETVVIAALLVTLICTVHVGVLLVAAMLACALLIVLSLSRRWERQWGDRRNRATTRIIAVLQECFAALKEIRVCRRERHFESLYADGRAALGRLARHRGLIESGPAFTRKTAFILGLGVAVLLLSRQDAPTVGMFPTLGILAYAGMRLLPSVNRIVVSTTHIRLSAAGMQEIHTDLCGDPASPFALCRGKPAKGNTEGGYPTKPMSVSHVVPPGVIQVDAVHYCYPGERNAGLHDVSLAITRGESIAIVGPTGAGKTTLLYLMLGLVRPDRGAVLVDGRSIHEDAAGWQCRLGYVPQEVCLFDATIAQNIAFVLDDSEIDKTLLDDVLLAAQIADWVESLPHGPDTIVGERGVRVSGGQRQRIAIARALYRRPAVLLLDEPASGIDRQTERALEEAILHGKPELTRIIVTHREETARGCDRVVFLQDGRLTDRATDDADPRAEHEEE